MKQSKLEWAIHYAQHNYAVFPVHSIINNKCSCGNPECRSAGKHPYTLGGVKEATTDLTLIKSWWNLHPNANIGLATGLVSGLFVLDIDLKNDGLESLSKLEQENGKLPITPIENTGGGGQHFFFKTNGLSIKNSASKIAPGVDIRGDGGYVVVSPSNHVSGGTYSWQQDKTLGEIDVTPPPEWLITLLTKNESKEKNTNSTCSTETNISEGSRNSFLTSEAGKLQRLGIAHDTILHTLLKVNIENCHPPLSEEEVKAIVASVTKYAPNFPCTDLGNVERLIYSYGDDIRYCTTQKKWYCWNGHKWQVDNNQQIDRYAKQVVRNIEREATLATEDTLKQALWKWERTSESRSRIKALIELAQSEVKIATVPDTFDSNPWLFNVQNGTIDLKTGRLHPHSRNNLITKIAPVTFDPEAQCPIWEKTILKCMNNNPEMSQYLQQIFGYALTGDIREQCIFIAYGIGANGKSTIINTVMSLLGEYATQTPTNTLMANNTSGIPNDIARLKGMRMVVASEGEDNQKLAEGLIKQLSGGDRVTARYLYGEFFDFIPACKVMLVTNHKPIIRGNDYGIWRRIKVIPFDVTIPIEERDSQLASKLTAESSGILNWLIKGCLEWQQHGITTPELIDDAIKLYMQESDPVAYFLKERCIEGEDKKVSLMDLYEAYIEWCDLNREKPSNRRRFNMRIKDKGFEARRSGPVGNTEWHGIGVLSAFNEGGLDISDDIVNLSDTSVVDTEAQQDRLIC